MDNNLSQVVGSDVNINGGQGQSISETVNNQGDKRVALALPAKSELVRLGNTWDVAIATGSAFTYVAAWPTTRAELVLYNGESSGGKSLIIDSAWMYNITSMAAAQHQTLIGQLSVVGTIPTDDTAQLITSASGKANYGGSAKRAVANTAALTTPTNKWRVLASSQPSAMTTNLGAAVFADLYGSFIVPPGYVFGLAGIAGTAAGTAIIGVRWHEVQLALG